MAQLAEKIAGSEKKSLLPMLLRAYADEWFAHYNFTFVSYTISGPASPALRQTLRRKANRALQHAEELAARLLQLGGQPVRKLDELSNHATNKPFKLPADPRDTDGALKAVLDAERTSIRTYSDMLLSIGGQDPVTTKLVTELLSEATAGESELERLLGRPAPEMTGR